jgi:hypothetical protein
MEGEGRGGRCVRADAIFTVRMRFLPRPQVNADAGGCPDDVRGRLDGHFHPKTSVMTSLPSKDHSHSLAPCAPAFLAGATGRRRRVSKKEGQQPLYSPPLGHPQAPPLGHPPRPRPPSGTHRALLRATPGLCRALVPLRRAPVHPPLGTRPGVHLHCSPIGYRGPPSSLRRATPSGPPSHSLYKYPCLP